MYCLYMASELTLQEVDICSLFSDDNNDSDPNADDEDWEHPSSSVGTIVDRKPSIDAIGSLLIDNHIDELQYHKETA